MHLESILSVINIFITTDKWWNLSPLGHHVLWPYFSHYNGKFYQTSWNTQKYNPVTETYSKDNNTVHLEIYKITLCSKYVHYQHNIPNKLYK